MSSPKKETKDASNFGNMFSKKSIIRALRQSSLFKHLPEADLRFVAQYCKSRQYFPDETIVWEGNPSNSLYVIVNGIVSVNKTISNKKRHTLAYLMPGNTFGEVGILENRPRSASVTTMSDVDVIVIRREDFLEILHKYPSIAVELARILGHYLTEFNRRQSRWNNNSRIVLLFNPFGGVGGTTIGNLLAKTLSERSGHPTVYTEYPTPQQVIADMGLKAKDKKYRHNSGYDILLAQEQNGLPAAAQTTVLLDGMMSDYANVIICIFGDEIDDTVAMMLNYANQVVLLSPPIPEAMRGIQNLQKHLREHIRTGEASIFTLVNRTKEEYQAVELAEDVDFEVPYMPDMPPLRLSESEQFKVPEPLEEVLALFVDRLERTQQIGVFIPTTIDVDKEIDAQRYVERALAFFGEHFGGATSKEAKGVWNSEEMGLVGETVFLVHSYVTANDLKQHMDSVIEFVKELKSEMRQEAMALEINQKLTLI